MSKEEILKKLNTVFCDVFDDDTLTVTEQTTADDIDEWDSLAHISLIAAIENEFGIRFDIRSALHMKSAGEIADAISALL
jgi:acyl carrier protein